MDETGQPGGTNPGENGKNAGRGGDHARLNGGWASDPWSNAGDALEPAAEPVVPTWRQASDNTANRAWAPSPSRYADLLAPPPAVRTERYGPSLVDPLTSPVDPLTPAVAMHAPASAPPYPYEGDLEDAARLTEHDRQVSPAERPATAVERPANTLDRPANLMDRPASIVDRPAYTIEQPGTSSQRPVNGRERPLISALSPGAPTERPLNSTPRPETSTEGPVSSFERVIPLERRTIPAERSVPQAERDCHGDPARHAALTDGTPRDGLSTIGPQGWAGTLRQPTPAPPTAAPPSAAPSTEPPIAAPPAPYGSQHARTGPVSEQLGTSAVPHAPPLRSVPPQLATFATSQHQDQNHDQSHDQDRDRVRDQGQSQAPALAPMPAYDLPSAYNPPTYHAPHLGYEPSTYEPGGYEPPAYEPSAYERSHERSAHEPSRYEPTWSGYEPSASGFDAVRSGYDAARTGRGPTTPAYDTARGYATAEAVPTSVHSMPAPDPADALPQRVPAEPDVPTVPEPPAVDPPAETPELARIATHLRRDDVPTELRDRPEGFDVKAVLAAVRGVAGVRDASLRTTPAGAHSLRLDLADGADPALVSREVARLLQEKLGLAAAPQNEPAPARSERPWSAPTAASFPPPEPPAATTAWSEPGYATPAPATEAPRPGRRRAPSPVRGRAAVDSRTDAPTTGPGYGATTSGSTLPRRPGDGAGHGVVAAPTAARRSASGTAGDHRPGAGQHVRAGRDCGGAPGRRHRTGGGFRQRAGGRRLRAATVRGLRECGGRRSAGQRAAARRPGAVLRRACRGRALRQL